MHSRKLFYIKLLELISCFFLFTHSLPCYTKIYTITEKGSSLECQVERIFSEIKSLAETEEITIQIKSGYYPISKPIEIKGWRHEIVFVGSKDSPPVISGSIEVTEWKVLPDGIWKGRVPDIVGRGNYFPDQLFVNGVRVSRSRIPGKGAFVLNDCFQEGTRFGAVLNREDIKLIRPFGEDEMPILSVFRKWTVSKRYLNEVSQPNNTLYFSGLGFSSNNELEKGNKIVVENVKEYVDAPGEWCYDKKGYIYYLPKKGETIENTIIRIPVVEKLVKIHSNMGDALGINFDNIIFEHTSYQVPKEGRELGQAAAPMSAAIEVDNVNNIHFDNCEIRGVANYGIWFRQCCLKSSVKNCYFHDLGAGAIKIGSLGKGSPDSLTRLITVENNIIHRYGTLMESAVGIILFNAADCKILHNDIRCGNYTGISIGWTWGYAYSPSKNNEIAYNRISHIGTGLLNDLGGIYTLGKSEGTRIHHNVISDITSGDYRGWGVYADEGTTGILVDRNVVWNSSSGGYHQHFGSKNIVTNNIFAWGTESQFTLTQANEELSLTFLRNIIIMETGSLMNGASINSKNYIIGNNCYWKVSSGYPKVGNVDVITWLLQRDSTSVYMAPSFKNPKDGDFRIQGNAISKAIGFKKFDYSKAGVYGKRKWRTLAESVR